MRIADLSDKRVAVWGFGREGRAALVAIGTQHPHLPLSLYCDQTEVACARALHPAIRVETCEPDAAMLSAHDVVVKSPGISGYKPAIIAAQKCGTIITSGTALWFAEHPDARVVAITGTKGKSTTSAMLAHLLRRLGVRTATGWKYWTAVAGAASAAGAVLGGGTVEFSNWRGR